jgi:hypothetical protein
MSILRKILLIGFVISFWFFFYWYRGIELSKEKPTPNSKHPTKTETLTQKKQTKDWK